MRYVLIFAVLLLLSCGGSVGGSYEQPPVQEDIPAGEYYEPPVVELPPPYAEVIRWRGVGGVLGGDGLFTATIRVYNPNQNLMNGFSLLVRAYNSNGGVMGVAEYSFGDNVQGFGSTVIKCRFPLSGRKRDVATMEAIVTSSY